MQILEFFYENPPQSKELLHRKLSLDGQNTVIKGAKNSGKRSLILNYLANFDKEEFLFLNFEDLRFNEACLVNLKTFIQKKQANQIHKKLKIIIFYGVGKDFCYEFSPILELTQCIVATEFLSLKLADFKELLLDFLDFEEFISISKKNVPVNSQVGAFLQNGRAFGVNLNEYLKAHFSQLDCEILRHIARNLGAEFSTNELYLRLKNNFKVSKDSLYKAISELEDRGVVCFLNHSQKRIKKVYFRDFALKNALCIDKNFKQLFANVVFTELLKLNTRLSYDKGFDFYLVRAKIAIILSPTLDLDLIKLRAKKMLAKALELGILHIVFITLSTEESFYEDGVKIDILPFDVWALGL
ncbi:ATP-binding protein [Campylobacter troglodytis]|uniref:ATP-binding protein n=1 Tax=Campylobacter troglodytis TaxID=654363 RepID=UPI00115965CE|nr:ATP-binding protein [Campylobacter troglodytis]TQR61342.1 DNA-binding protein [Campylobacter troglodytis]